MKARIYQPSKSTMQSGRGKTDGWVLEYETETARKPEPVMGWTSSGDTLNQVIMKFDTKASAVAFADSKGLKYTVDETKQRKVVPRSYLDNFKFRPQEDEK